MIEIKISNLPKLFTFHDWWAADTSRKDVLSVGCLSHSSAMKILSYLNLLCSILSYTSIFLIVAV